MKCRHCRQPLKHIFLDLKTAPPSNAYLNEAQLLLPETKYPLKIFICRVCWLAQTEDYAKVSELFSSEYAYFSSTSQTWLQHAALYAEMISKRLGLNQSSFVIEIASNDGYLLKNFVAKNIPCLGIEPTESTAMVAEKNGIPVLRQFFSAKTAKVLAQQGKLADLICGCNVYAHVPDINDFTLGLKIALKPGGTVNLEFPHLLRLIEKKQFDTVYHEHFSYLSLYTVARIFAQADLRLFDVEELSTHGGSLRIYGCHAADERQTETRVTKILDDEIQFGLQDFATYKSFQAKADKITYDFRTFLIAQKKAGKTIAAYGAAAKGNTLMNYAGIDTDLIAFVCDAAVAKQNKFMPGSRIPILPPSELVKRKPDWVVILPWNIADEVVSQQREVYNWGGSFVVAIPELKVLSQ